MKYFISITVILFLLICTWSCALKVHEKHLYKTEVEAVHSGTMVDKKIVNPENGLFKSHGTEYYIIIDTGIDKPTLLPDGEKLTKSFSVSEDVYLKYNVGWYKEKTAKNLLNTNGNESSLSITLRI